MATKKSQITNRTVFTSIAVFLFFFIFSFSLSKERGFEWLMENRLGFVVAAVVSIIFLIGLIKLTKDEDTTDESLELKSLETLGNQDYEDELV